jgi:hypothetical protein
MEVQYQPETNDYYAAQQHICRSVARDSAWRFVPKVLGGIFGFCIALGAIAIGKFYDKYKFLDLYELNWGLGIIALGFIVLVFGLRSYNRAIKPRMFNPEGLYRSPHKISLANDNMVVTVKNNKYAYSYGDVLRVDDDQNYVYVFIDNGAALYIPAKTFKTAEAKKAFISELSNKINR